MIVSDIPQAIRWAVANQVDIISMSWALLHETRDLKKAIHEADRSGILLFASASDSGNVMTVPAGYDEVFSIGAATTSESPWNGRINPDFMLPGSDPGIKQL